MQPSHDLSPSALEAFVASVGAGRFLAVRDGHLVCLDPDDREAQRLYLQVNAAIAAGTITDLRADASTSGVSDREI